MSLSLYQIISHAEVRFPYFSPSHGGRNVQLSYMSCHSMTLGAGDRGDRYQLRVSNTD